jgi:uncharacterized RDD family membrane protein YckC
MNSPLQIFLVTAAPPALSWRGEGEVLGIDNVRLDLPLAGVASRTLAASLDQAFLLLFQIVWLLAGVISLPFFGVSVGWVLALLGLGFFLLQWGYFAALEILMKGQTPGKQLVGLRTVAYHGGRATAAALLIRNLLRSIDVLIGVLLMVFDRRSRRLGDFIAETLVIYEQEESVEEAQMVRHPPAWGAPEVSVVETFLRRVRYLDRERAQKIAQRLLSWLEQREPGFLAEVEATAVDTGDPVERLQQIFESGD